MQPKQIGYGQLRGVARSMAILVFLSIAACGRMPEPAGSISSASTSQVPADEVVVYASDLPESALSEFKFLDDPASPGGKLAGTTNNGDELDPPPENDPHVSFTVDVVPNVAYRCWVHMKVGASKGKSQANMLWVQFSEATDAAGEEVYRLGTDSYLTAQGAAQEGWTWTGCDGADADAPGHLVYFRTSGEVTVRVQAGMEGVGFDQLVLSPAQFLETPPSETVVKQ